MCVCMCVCLEGGACVYTSYTIWKYLCTPMTNSYEEYVQTFVPRLTSVRGLH